MTLLRCSSAHLVVAFIGLKVRVCLGFGVCLRGVNGEESGRYSTMGLSRWESGSRGRWVSTEWKKRMDDQMEAMGLYTGC